MQPGGAKGRVTPRRGAALRAPLAATALLSLARRPAVARADDVEGKLSGEVRICVGLHSRLWRSDSALLRAPDRLRPPQVAQVEEALATDADPVEAAALQAEVQAIEKEVAAVDELEQQGATAEAEKEARGIQEQITDIFSILSLGK